MAAGVHAVSGLSEGFFLLVFSLNELLWTWKLSPASDNTEERTSPLIVCKSNKSLGTPYTRSAGHDETISVCFHPAEGKCLLAAVPSEISFL